MGGDGFDLSPRTADAKGRANGQRNDHNFPGTGAELGPNLGPKLSQTDRHCAGPQGTASSREANKSARFGTPYNVRGRASAISKTGGWGFRGQGLGLDHATYDIPGQ
jgi:hypothetical protein